METQSYTVSNNKVNLQFQVELGGEIAYLTYRFYKNNIAFMHTFVPNKLSGRGIASALASYAFAYAGEQKKLVMVYCPFVSKFIKKNTKYLSQLDRAYIGGK